MSRPVGLDPIQIIEIRDLIRELGREHTVVFSSHILSEVQTICDQILIIAKGKLVAFDEPGNLERRLLAPSEITLTAEATEQEVRDILSGVGRITGLDLEREAAGNVMARLKTEHDDIYEVSRAVFFAFAEQKKAAGNDLEKGKSGGHFPGTDGQCPAGRPGVRCRNGRRMWRKRGG